MLRWVRNKIQFQQCTLFRLSSQSDWSHPRHCKQKKHSSLFPAPSNQRCNFIKLISIYLDTNVTILRFITAPFTIIIIVWASARVKHTRELCEMQGEEIYESFSFSLFVVSRFVRFSIIEMQLFILVNLLILALSSTRCVFFYAIVIASHFSLRSCRVAVCKKKRARELQPSSTWFESLGREGKEQLRDFQQLQTSSEMDFFFLLLHQYERASVRKII